jgi:hypothetical protein
MVKPQTIKELAKELGYSERHTRDIASDMVSKGEWIVTTVPIQVTVFIKAYCRKRPKKKKT